MGDGRKARWLLRQTCGFLQKSYGCVSGVERTQGPYIPPIHSASSHRKMTSTAVGTPNCWVQAHRSVRPEFIIERHLPLEIEHKSLAQRIHRHCSHFSRLTFSKLVFVWRRYRLLTSRSRNHGEPSAIASTGHAPACDGRRTPPTHAGRSDPANSHAA